MTNEEKLKKVLPIIDEIESLHSMMQLNFSKNAEIRKKVAALEQRAADIVESEAGEFGGKTGTTLEIDIRQKIDHLAAQEYFRMMKEGTGNE